MSKPQLLAEVDAPLHNFWRSAKWCPDGEAILGQREDSTLCMFSVPNLDNITKSSTPRSLLQTSTLVAPSPVTSYEWYPFASVNDLATFCYVRSVTNSSIELRDGTSGNLRASYSIIDHCERFVAPHSLAFSLDGTRLFCGHSNAIDIFDLSSPGATSERSNTSPNKRSKDGQKGIISSLTFSTHSPTYLAAGSYSGSIGLYDTTSGSANLVGCLKEGISGGITDLAFDRSRSWILYSACRNSDSLDIWDLRNPYEGPFISLSRPGKTNQRLGFSAHPQGLEIAFGDNHGNVSRCRLPPGQEEEEEETITLVEPTLKFSAHKDAIGSTAYHPTRPLLLTCSGSRHFDTESWSDTSSSSSSDEDEILSTSDDNLAEKRPRMLKSQAKEAKIRIWNLATDSQERE